MLAAFLQEPKQYETKVLKDGCYIGCFGSGPEFDSAKQSKAVTEKQAKIFCNRYQML